MSAANEAVLVIGDEPVNPSLQPLLRLAAAMAALVAVVAGDFGQLPNVLRPRVRRGWRVRLDADGISWFEGPRLSWSAIAEVRLPAESRLCDLLGWRGRVVVMSHAQLAWAARARTSPHGQVVPTTRRHPPAAVAAAVARFSDVPLLPTTRLR